jgi:signal transduction histidine kinase
MGDHNRTERKEDRYDMDSRTHSGAHDLYAGASATTAGQSVKVAALYDASRSLLESLGHVEDEELLARHGLRLLMTLLNARYGAIGIVDRQGALQRFIYEGLSAAEAQRIAHLPEGKGLLGAVLTDGAALRIDDMSHDPRAVGFPPNHPPMKSLLAVPVAQGGDIVGRLYLCDRFDGRPFSKDDETLAGTFARQLALMVVAERHRQSAQRAQAETTRLLAENRQLASRLFAAQEEERRYLARELHDELAQYLTAMRTEAQRLILLTGTTDTSSIQEGALALATLCERTHDLTREVLRGLAPTLLYESGLADALRELVESFERHQPRIVFRLALAGNLQGLDNQTAVTAYRVIQEALANAVRHAAPTRVFVGVRRLATAEKTLRISVRDNGNGFDPAAVTRSVGLIGMRERVQALNGELHIRSRPGSGSYIEARLPAPARQGAS